MERIEQPIAGTISSEVFYTEHFGLSIDSTGQLIMDQFSVTGFRTYWNKRDSKNILIPQAI